jgi:hypothetical protein
MARSGLRLRFLWIPTVIVKASPRIWPFSASLVWGVDYKIAPKFFPALYFAKVDRGSFK